MSRFIFIIVFLFISTNALGQASFQLLGGLPPGGLYCTPYAMSADGTTIVGIGPPSDSPSASSVFYWRNSEFTNLNEIAPAGFTPYYAYGLSGDGSVVVGQGRYTLGGKEAFRWENGVMITLGDLQNGGALSEARGVSADGSIVVGFGYHPDGDEAFRWENGVMVGLGDLPGGRFHSQAYAISADGSVIVGVSVSDRGTEAFRWENGEMIGLGFLPGGTGSVAYAVSADGRVVAGHGDTTNTFLSSYFRWENDSMVSLDIQIADGGIEGGRRLAISADGTTFVGNYFWRSPFIWNKKSGMRDFNDVFDDLGVNASFGWPTGISADGYTIVGYSGSLDPRRGWLAQLPSEPAIDTDEDGISDHLDTCPNTILGIKVDRFGCPPTIPGDFDRDGDVDLLDYNTWQRCMSGTDVSGDPACNTIP